MTLTIQFHIRSNDLNTGKKGKERTICPDHKSKLGNRGKRKVATEREREKRKLRERKIEKKESCDREREK